MSFHNSKMFISNYKLTTQISIFLDYETLSNSMNNYAKLLQCLQNSGLVERFHQSLQNMLHKYIHEKKERLFRHLLICLQHFKTLMNQSTKVYSI